MTFDEFKRVLTTFADNPNALDFDKGRLLIQIMDEVLEVEVRQKAGSVLVTDNGDELPADQWLINRVARLPQLADRILSYIEQEPSFVTPSGKLLDQLEQSTTDEPQPVDDAATTIRRVLDRRPAGTSSVLYLTSDAGEGKTTLINYVAYEQAKAYKKKETDWLLIPISLGGRPFLRFDDIITASLVNRLRFNFYWYAAFLELVRMGVLVPALDGFEEMFMVSSSGEALSALGNLLESLESSGTLLISARKAYFEYKSFGNRAKIYDAIRSQSAAFADLAINRWDKQQFLEYCNKRQIGDCGSLYEEVLARFGPHHPLLTRAVLVRRLLDVAGPMTNISSLLGKLGTAPEDYFYQFVDTIIEREATEKWLDTSGQTSVAQQLLSVQEHHILLSLIAQEMWLVSSDQIKDDALDVIAEIFADTYSKTPVVSRQIKERLKQHALIINVPGNRLMFTFDHEEFKNFFLGQAIGRTIAENAINDLRTMLRAALLPNQAFDSAIQYLRTSAFDLEAALKLLQEMSRAEIITSFARENCGGLIIRLLDGFEKSPVLVQTVSFPLDALAGRKIHNATFKTCYFQPSRLDSSELKDCVFESCSFDRIELHPRTELANVRLIDCGVTSLISADGENRVFGPNEITSLLARAGFDLPAHSQEQMEEPVAVWDEDLRALERLLRTFTRATVIREDTIRWRLGEAAPTFIETVLPRLIRVGILNAVFDPISGKHDRYRVGVKMQDIDDAFVSSEGRLDSFLQYFDKAGEL